jgi:hypothetical protein
MVINHARVALSPGVDTNKGSGSKCDKAVKWLISINHTIVRSLTRQSVEQKHEQIKQWLSVRINNVVIAIRSWNNA